MNSTLSIVLWSLLAVGFVIGFAIVAWYLYKNVFQPRRLARQRKMFRPDVLAREIIRSKDARVPYDDICDTFFAEDPYLSKQYFDMKLERPRTEVLNLCYNRARGVLNQK